MKLELPPRCFQGVCPAVIATCAADGTPNVTYLSQVYYVDERHVALSCQFFNKTRKNVEENPYANVQLYDPLTFEAYRLELRYDHSQTEGPLYDTMALRIQAIASHTGMAGIFRLLSADVYEVLSIERVEDFLTASQDPERPQGPSPGPMTELRGLQLVSHRINAARDLDGLLSSALAAMDEAFGFDHSIVLLPDESGEKLFTVASHGYGESGVGAEVSVGEGLIGTVARQRKMMRLGGVNAELRYGRAIRERARALGATEFLPEVPLPGLPDAQSQLVLPLVAFDRLVGVLAVESHHALRFEEWHEAFLEVIGNQIAIGIDRMSARAEAEEGAELESAGDVALAPPSLRPRMFVFYPQDDCVFVDGEYLIRNLPGKILWKILREHQRDGRREFSNRELRLDGSLGLPAVKDNLESRLILLRRRLEQKCPDVKLVPTRRGRFALEIGCPFELVEKECSKERGGAV